MDIADRPAKKLGARSSTAKVTEGVTRGHAKDGRMMSALRREQTGRQKPTVKAASALYGRSTGGKRGPQVAAHDAENASGQSVRLRLQVSRGRIAVLDSALVDAAAPDEVAVSGTTFIEMRAGNRVIALQSLVDPGLSVGIPDASDSPDEFRGHRVVQEPTWEVAIRVPVDALRECDPNELRIGIYSASRHVEIDARSRHPLADRTGTISELATSAPLRAKDLPGEVTAGGTGRKRGRSARD
jgi:hypothetical protein